MIRSKLNGDYDLLSFRIEKWSNKWLQKILLSILQFTETYLQIAFSFHNWHQTFSLKKTHNILRE